MMLGRVNAFLLMMMVFLAPALAWAEEAATHAEEDGGGTMPQLDPTYYASQLFWLVISGILLYLLMAKFALPRVARIIEMRDDQVRHDLEKAARMRQEAEDVKFSYTRALRDADERARALTERTINEIRDRQTQALSESSIRINQRIADTETNLLTQKETILDDVPAISKKLSDTIIRELTAKAA